MSIFEELKRSNVFRAGIAYAVVTWVLLQGAAGVFASDPPLNWMTGHWCVEQDSEVIEEFWLAPVGGTMIGLGRTNTTDKTTGFEYLRVVDKDGVQNFIAQPFGNPPTAFLRTAGGADWVRFENPGHDFPQRIEYRRDGNVLLAQAAGPGSDGQESVLSFEYAPCDAATPAHGDVDAIESLRAEFNEAIARRDLAAMASFLDEDYVITISTGAIERSREASLESFAAHFAEFPDVIYVRTPSEITLSDAYPLAIENGTWVGLRTTKNGPLENGGQYSAGWRYVDGAWKIYSELFVGLYCRGADC